MQYRGFEVRENRKTGQWQAIRPTDATWEDGLSAPDRFALKAQIDNYHAALKPNPWQLPTAPAQVIAA
jgi:hypothetical protein